MSKLSRLIATLIAVVGMATPVLAQQRGTVSGTVRSEANEPLVGATVTVVGTTLRTVTDQQGRYRIGTVPVGAQSVSATVIGYAARTQRVTITAGEAATADFRLSPSALQIGGVVVTATGREQRTRELGSSVGVVTTADVSMATVTNASQLLQARVPGTVVMQSSGTTGGGARVRIRGNNSISLSNAPLLVVDGIRVESAETGAGAALGFGVGGQTPSRLNDISPENIESMEVLKGPAAAALYGTAAANGVIQITTKRGRAGRPEVRAWAEYGTLERTAEIPVNTYAVGVLTNARGVMKDTTGANIIGRCDIVRQAIGLNATGTQVGCTGVTQTFTASPLTAAATTPFRDGDRNTFGASVSGGSEAATYYFSGDAERETGVLNANDLRRIRVQANTTGRIGTKLTLGSSVAYMSNRLQLPQSDNALYGIFPQGLYGSADPALFATTQGFESGAAFANDYFVFQRYGRLTGSLRGDYRPISWLSINGNVGLDRYAREDMQRIPRRSAYSSRGGVFTNGFIQNYTHDIYNLTSNASATAIFDLRSDLSSTTAVGTQYLRENFHRIYAFGAGLTPGVETSLAGATSDFSTGEDNILNATVSAYAQQQFAWRDRVFLNAAVRGDQNTAFGTNIGWIFYPSFSGSWVVSDEPFFPELNALNNFRLRAAYGQSGLRPGASDALQSFASQVTTAVTRSDIAAVVFPATTLGNNDLKPERSREFEMGFEAGFFDNRLGLDFTYFNKKSTDALVSQPIAGSLGAATNRFVNLGQVNNSGLEFALRTQPVRGPTFNWNVNLNASRVRNELTSLGKDAQGRPIPAITLGFSQFQQRHQEGFALGSYFGNPITGYEDKNKDGLLSPNEVTVRRDTLVYLGNPFPRRELALNSDLRFRDWFRVSALLDYKGGYQLANYTRANRCSVATSNCAELYDRNTPLEQQAAIVAFRDYGAGAGFIENASFVKLREVAVTFGLPQELAQRFSARGASFTIAGRNLRTWTDYTGLDPELNSQGQANFTTVELGTLPPNRVVTFRIDTNF